MKKRYVVVFYPPGRQDGFFLFLREKPEITVESSYDGRSRVQTDTIVADPWSVLAHNARRFATEKAAQRAAFEVVVQAPADYVGRVEARKLKRSDYIPLKVRRRRVEDWSKRKRDTWPFSSGRDRRKVHSKD